MIDMTGINQIVGDQKDCVECSVCGFRRKRNLVADDNTIKCLRCKTLGITKNDESSLDNRKPYRYRKREIFVVNDERKKLKMKRR